jgi:hypothetical protein
VARIAPPPPPGAPAELVLAAVLAERHRRELARMRPAMPPAPLGPPGGPWAATPQFPTQVVPPRPQPVPGPHPTPEQPGGFAPPA